jgi:hypothetical protein
MPPSKRLRISDRYHGSERRCYHGAVLPSPVPSRAVSASDICEALVPMSHSRVRGRRSLASAAKEKGCARTLVGRSARAGEEVVEDPVHLHDEGDMALAVVEVCAGTGDVLG